MMSSPRSHRPLPLEDAVIDRLGADARQCVAGRWADRASNELGTSTTFADIYRELVLLKAPPPVLEIAARAIDDELRHAQICHFVAERYAGREVGAPETRGTDPPRFAGCTERQNWVLHVVLHGCLNEGVAVAYLGACLDDAESPLARAAIHDILEDEVVHARLGWAFIAASSDDDRRLIGEALPELLREIEKLWLRPTDLPENLPGGHGCLGLGRLRSVFRDAAAELLVPGFEHVGIETSKARQWLACVNP
jgi:hypothetical protein